MYAHELYSTYNLTKIIAKAIYTLFQPSAITEQPESTAIGSQVTMPSALHTKAPPPGFIGL